ncbi:MAG: YolD-like family protein, partial [Campylobacter sp.]|nr:YolD-like family protein [Campylobacter sp.]
KAQEHQISEKLELDASVVEKNLQILSTLKSRDFVNLIYHDGYEYKNICGLVSNINFKSAELTVIKSKIKFDDIYKISKNI